MQSEVYPREHLQLGSRQRTARRPPPGCPQTAVELQLLPASFSITFSQAQGNQHDVTFGRYLYKQVA